MAHSNPWQVAPLGEYRYEFTNVSDIRFAAIPVDSFEGGELDIEHGGNPNDRNAVNNREPGESFTAKVRGSVRIMATDPVTYENVPWRFDAP